MTIQIAANQKSHSPATSDAERSVPSAMARGASHCCPACGKGRLFSSYLKIANDCSACGQALHHHRADDAPPYFTILIVGHIVIGGILTMEQAYAPASWIHMAIWVPLTLLMSLALLPRIKGALVGLQWALRMHGFAGNPTVTVEQSPIHLESDKLNS